MSKIEYRPNATTVFVVGVCLIGFGSICGCEIPTPSDEAVAQAGPPEPIYLEEGSEEQKKFNETKAKEEKKKQVKADAGTGARVDSPDGIITTPINAYFSIKEGLIFKQIDNGLKLFYAQRGRKPKDFEEVQKSIIKIRQLSLPKLKPGDKYVFNPDEGQYGAVMVQKGGAKDSGKDEAEKKPADAAGETP
jgi:hypothetical protein